MSKLLADRKIGVLLESLYIPDEVAAYQKDFADLGAEVQLMSYLWGQPKARFVSDPNGFDDQGNPRTAETIEVNIDFTKVKLDDFSAIIMAANYTSVRLRYFVPPQRPQDSPAVKFYAAAMENPRIVKGALCHGLWILSARPDLLYGRKVICHEVVQADVVNAGGIITKSDTNVVVDRDLVTGHSKDDVHAFIRTVAEEIGRRSLVVPSVKGKS